MKKTCTLIPTFLLLATLLASTSLAADWPPLPPKDGTADIPAQAWPFQPGDRTVKAYVFYPGGSIDNVGPETGLMLNLHNWGGTGFRGACDPNYLTKEFNVVAVSVDYVQSGKWREDDAPYDCGYYQSLDALRALYWVYNGLEKAGKAFDRSRIFATGGSGGGNVTLMVNKLAPRTFTCAVDMCGMAKLSDAIAFGEPGKTKLNAGYSRDPNSPRYLSPAAQAIRFPGHPGHLKTMKKLGNACKMMVVHGTTDHACPVDDAKEYCANMQAAGLDVEPHIITEKEIDGTAVKVTGHPLGNRTLIVGRFGGKYMRPDSDKKMTRTTPCDFQLRDENVRYEAPGGVFIISYKNGYPVGRFEKTE